MTTKKRILLAAILSLAGINLPSSAWHIPTGSTPNRYKPHVGAKQIAKALIKLRSEK